MEEKMYTEKDLIDFGNYLLSGERGESIIHPQVRDKVNDVDILNWQDK